MQLLHVTAEVEKLVSLFVPVKCHPPVRCLYTQPLASHVAHSSFSRGILTRTSQNDF